MRLSPLVLLLAVGCATPIKTPCRFTVDVEIIDDTDEVCRERGSRPHDGQAASESRIRRGCATSKWIVAEPSRGVVDHEMWEHVIARNCGKGDKVHEVKP